MKTSRPKPRVILVVLAALAVCLAACSGSGSGGTTAPASPAAGAVVITIEDFKYTGPESVAPGATVTVTNMDSAPHTVTADEGTAFDAVVAGGETTTFTAPMEPGTYSYHCTYHVNMVGSLVVK